LNGVNQALATPADHAGDGLRRVLPIHLGLALLVAGGFFVLAPVVGGFAGAPHVVPGLRLLSFVMLTYGAYAPLVGALNGRARFVRQAGLDALAATLRTGGLIGGAVWLGRAGFSRDWNGVEGAALGFVLSSALVLGIALAAVRLGAQKSQGPSASAYLGYVLPILLGQVLLNLLYQADQLLLRRFASDAALAANLTPAAADPFVGAYRATQLFCFLPYQLLIAVSVVLFPLVAATGNAKDAASVARYVQSGVRISLLVIGLLVSVTSGLAGPLLRLVFGADAALLGARPMQLSALGLGAFALFGVLTSVLNGLQAQRLSLGVTGLAFALVTLLCFWLVPGQALGPALLWRTALATSSALGLATLVAAWLVKWRTGALISALSVARILAALAGAIALGRHLPAPSALQTPLFSLLVAATYLVLLAVLGELSKRDWSLVVRVLGRA
jgi:stage V sporulation protein B